MGRISTKACSKLLLFGEHSAVYGYPALGIPLNFYLQLNYKPLITKSWQTIGLEKQAELAIFQLLSFYQSKFPLLEDFKGQISIDSQVPIALGFGSSASLCVAFSRLINQLLDLNLSEKELWQLSHEAEKLFHGSPSGVDTGLIVKQRPCFFSLKDSDLPACKLITHCPDWYLVVGALPRNVKARQTIEDFKKRLKFDLSLEKYLKELGEISTASVNLGLKDFKLMADLVNRAHKILDLLNFSNKLLNNILELGKSLGASAGKLSGAGKGGAFYFLLETEEQALNFYDKIQEKIKDKVVQKLEIISLQIKARSIL